MSQITLRDFNVLDFVARYETVTRAMITQELFPADVVGGGRVTRKRLGVLRSLGLISVTNTSWCNPSDMGGMASPVYFPGSNLPAFLAQECEDNSYLLLNS